jgi:hypothetical protein
VSTSSTSSARRQRRRIQPYLPHDLHKRFAAFCAARAARSESAKRYQQFVDHVGAKLATGHRFVDDLTKESIADPCELSAFASAELDQPGDSER